MDVVALKKICFITIKNQCHNMASFSYNTDDFPALPSKEFSRQSVSVYISVKPREQILYLFLTRWNHFCLKTNMFVCTSKACMLPLQSDDIFNTRSPVLSRKPFVCTTSGPSHACLSPFPPVAVRNCKNIRYRSIPDNLFAAWLF